MDYFHSILDKKNQHRRVRVSRAYVGEGAGEDGPVLRCIEKKRIANVHFHFPFAPFDIRVTMNAENPSTSSSVTAPVFVHDSRIN